MAVAAFGKSFVLLQSIHGLRPPQILPQIHGLRPPQILHDIIAPHSAAISTRRRNISSLSTEDSLIKRLTDELKDLAEERRVRNAAPDWLPFRPGSSYWLPGSRHLDYDDSERSLKKQEDREKMVLFDSSLDSEN
jgi:hypothetical protein